MYQFPIFWASLPKAAPYSLWFLTKMRQGKGRFLATSDIVAIKWQLNLTETLHLSRMVHTAGCPRGHALHGRCAALHWGKAAVSAWRLGLFFS